ncbi:unnamed protein product [Closterium sp. NIES-53]
MGVSFAPASLPGSALSRASDSPGRCQSPHNRMGLLSAALACRVSRGVGSAFRVWGCLALVRATSADKLSARAIPCVFLGFLVGSPDYSFYHPPLHQFLDSRDVRFDESVSYDTQYPCRGLPVPPPPLFLAPSPHPAPAPPVPPPPPGPALSRGVGAGGAGTGSAQSGGACSRGAGAGGTGTGGAISGVVGARGTSTGGANPGGAGAGGIGTGGASSGGAGAGGTGTGDASSWGAGAGGACAPEEQEQLEQERQELQRLDQQQEQQPSLLQQLFPPVRGLRALSLPSSPPVHSQSPTTYGPTFPPPDSNPAVFSPPQSQSPPLVFRHDWTSRFPPRAWPSSPLADLRTVLFRSPPRSPPLSVLPSPPASSLTVSSHRITDYYRAARPVVSRVLASLITDPRASPWGGCSTSPSSVRRGWFCPWL